ncbi:MAG TPA: phytanoyl-CoA dioxygenase family protein [Planctomycetota bacterium]|nr:phytanoyl-CoA dioxygenase family protein [Planctomycetota bacterium]
MSTLARPAAPAPALTAEQQRALRDDGFVILRGIVPRERLAAVLRRFAAVGDRMVETLRRDGAPVDDHPDAPDERRLALATARCRKEFARFGRGWRREVVGQEVFALQTAPPLVDAVAGMLGEEVYGHIVLNARPKLPDQRLTTVPWHQDSAYFGPQYVGQRIVTAWVPLVDVDERNGCMQVALGSHRYGNVAHHVEDAEGGFLEITGGDPRADVTVTCAMAPGDVLLFEQLLWHRSLPNVGDGVRWSVDLRYYGAGFDARESLPRPWTIRHPTLPPVAFEEWIGWRERF